MTDHAQDDHDLPKFDAEAADEGVFRLAHNRARLRWPKRLVLGGFAASLVLSFVASAGDDGQLGAALFFLLLSLFLGLAAVVTTSHLMYDEIKGRPTSRGRAIVAAMLLVAAFMAVMMHSGVSQGMVSA
ncbi:MAG: hypothetical protein ACJA2F_001178 [Nitriliruptoraceae bacterium]